jgi:Sucrose hydrolase-like, C-terminal domain
MDRLIRTRKACPEIGWGTFQLLDAGASSLFAQRFDWGDRSTILLHNLAGKREHARLRFDRCEDWEHLHDLLGDGDVELLQDKRLELDLDPYGYRWLRVHRKGQRFLP